MPTGCSGGGPLFVQTGQLDINVYSTDVTDVFQTTTMTTTYLTTQVYDLIGLPQTASAVPEPASLLLLSELVTLGAVPHRGRGGHGCRASSRHRRSRRMRQIPYTLIDSQNTSITTHGRLRFVVSETRTSTEPARFSAESANPPRRAARSGSGNRQG